jgi:signal transduction histidine kinase/ligand-binding sensor domain-containing protein
LLIIACQAAGQETAFVPLTRLSVDNGLSSSNIRKIVQDKYGFLWISTQDGLNRFEGKQIEVLNAGNKNPHRSLPGQDIYDITLDQSGEYLWALIPYAGLSKIDIRTVSVVKNYLRANGTEQPNLWYKCMMQFQDQLYIGTNEGAIIGFDKKKEKVSFRLQTKDLFGIDYPVDKLHCSADGRLYIFLSGKGILVYDPIRQRMIELIDTRKLYLDGYAFQFTDVTEHAGVIWITTSLGLRCLTSHNNQVLYPRKLQTTPSLWFLNKYLSTVSVYNGQVLYSGKDGLFQTDTALDHPVQIQPTRNYENHDLFELANCIFQQGQVIWVGSQYGLAWIKNRFSPFMGLTNSLNGNGNRIKHSMSLLPITDSVMAVCSDDALFFANHQTGTINRFAVPDFYLAAFKAPDGLFIASGDQGLKLFNAAQESLPLEKHFPELSAVSQDLLVSATAWSDSLIFMASQNQHGLYKWNHQTRTVSVINTTSNGPKLQSNVINRLFTDSRKRLWILCDNVISLYDIRNNRMQHFTLTDPEQKKPMSVIMDICEAANAFWLAVYGVGIVALKEDMSVKKIYTLQHGINNLGLYKIMKLSDSTLIASTNNGITVLNIRKGRAANYFEEDGLHSSSFEETSGAVSGNYLFLGGFNGFTRIDPKKFSTNSKAPSLYFSNASVRTADSDNDSLNIFMESLTIPSDASQVTISFSAVNYTGPEKVRFQYKLLPISNQWESSGHESFLNLVGIGPGSYTLQVRASNEDGIWSEPIAMTLHFQPKWFQTWWFTVLCIVVALSIILLLVRMRLHQLSREEAIRRKLSSDLHDDLGSTLNSVKVHANLAMMDPGNATYLQRIKEGTQQAIVSTRDLIWVLDDKKDTVDHLISRVMQFAEPLCDAQGITLTKNISSDAWNFKLGKEEKRNLYMILKESINNSVKYANCRNILLEILIEGKRLHISVSDDGAGFNQETVTPGNGTTNIHSRAKDAGYQAMIRTAPGKGTTIQLTAT